MQKKVVTMPAIYYFLSISLNCKEVSHDNKYEYSLRTISEVILSSFFLLSANQFIFLSFTLYGLVYGQVCSLFI